MGPPPLPRSLTDVRDSHYKSAPPMPSRAALDAWALPDVSREHSLTSAYGYQLYARADELIRVLGQTEARFLQTMATARGLEQSCDELREQLRVVNDSIRDAEGVRAPSPSPSASNTSPLE